MLGSDLSPTPSIHSVPMWLNRKIISSTVCGIVLVCHSHMMLSYVSFVIETWGNVFAYVRGDVMLFVFNAAAFLHFESKVRIASLTVFEVVRLLFVFYGAA